MRAIHEHDRGKKAEDICRDLGVSQASFYAWKKQYAGLGIAELRELRQLREENARLKTIVGLDAGSADPAGDTVKNSLKPAQRRELVDWARALWLALIGPVSGGTSRVRSF